MTSDWFEKKWGSNFQLPTEELYEIIEDLQRKYHGLLLDVKRLEEENVETSNLLYEIMNTLDSIQGYKNVQ